MAIRAFTHGYDLFHPHYAPVRHEYGTNRKRIWDDRGDWQDLVKMSLQRVDSLCGLNETNLGRWGPGKERTIQDYLDFADISTVLLKGGSAFMAIGKGVGDNRASEAAEQVINSTLLNTTIAGATGVVYNIKAKTSPLVQEFREIGQAIQDVVAPNAEIFQGWALDPELEDEIHVTLLATGIPHDRHRTMAGTISNITNQPKSKINQPKSKWINNASSGDGVERVPLRPSARQNSTRQKSGLPDFLSNS